MQPLTPQPGLTEQVYQAIVAAICDGTLAAGTHLVQEKLAANLGVSRQPVQQALALLKTEGIVQELGGRGLFVAPLDPEVMRQHYEIRGTLDGLAARLAAVRAAASPAVAAEIAREGERQIADGLAAVRSGQYADMVQQDVAFHDFLYTASGNPLLTSTAAPHWRYLRRVMNDVLRRAEPPETIWRQHEDILAAVVSGDAAIAESRAEAHVTRAGERLAAALVPPTENQGGSHDDAGRADARRSARRTGAPRPV